VILPIDGRSRKGDTASRPATGRPNHTAHGLTCGFRAE